MPRATERANLKFANAIAPIDNGRMEAIIAKADVDRRIQILREMAALSNHNFSIPEIAIALEQFHRRTVRKFGDANTRASVRKAQSQGTLNMIVAAMELSEVFVWEAVSLKVRAMTGKLKTTPEQLGTLQRAIENALATSKVFCGKKIEDLIPLAQDIEKDLKGQAPALSAGLTQAQKNIEEIRKRQREAKEKVNGMVDEEPEP